MRKNKFLELQNGSDIRGVALPGVEGEEVNLTKLEAMRIGASFANWLTYKLNINPLNLKICVGQDPRLSGDELAEGLMRGIAYVGSQIEYAGLASTPAMFMSTVMPYYEFDGAVMITASHLPFNRNGFKFFTAGGGLDKEDVEQILKFASKINFQPDFPYEYEKVQLMDMYAATLRQMITNGLKSDLKGMHIVIDAGNGSGGFFATQVLQPLGADISGSQFLEPDGHFPNHIPNPENKEAMASICQAVKDSGADLGIIFDTDVDRISAVDGKGQPISRNHIIALAAALAADDHPGGTVVTDSITSDELTDFLQGTLGLKHFRFKRGYRNVINKAADLQKAGEDAFLAIETSGHCAFSDNYFMDDGAFLAVNIIVAAAKIKKENGGDIRSLIADLSSPEEASEFRLNITDPEFAEKADQVLATIEEFANSHEGYSVVSPNYEGIRVNFNLDGAKGWFLARKSLHDPVLPVNIESEKTGGVRKVADMLAQLLAGMDGIDEGPLK